MKSVSYQTERLNYIHWVQNCLKWCFPPSHENLRSFLRVSTVLSGITMAMFKCRQQS